MNEDNLIPGQHKLTLDEQSAGGRASGRARRLKARGRQLIQDLLALRQPDPKILADLERYGINTKDLTNEVAMTLRQVDKAIRKADTFAYMTVLKAAGITDEAPTSPAVGIQINFTDPAAAEGLRLAISTGAQPAPPEDERQSD